MAGTLRGARRAGLRGQRTPTRPGSGSGRDARRPRAAGRARAGSADRAYLRRTRGGRVSFDPNKLMKQVQQMQADMAARAGGARRGARRGHGRRGHGHRHRVRLGRHRGHLDQARGGRPRGRRDARGPDRGRRQRGLAGLPGAAAEAPRRRSRAASAAPAASGCPACRAAFVPCSRRPSTTLVTQLARLPGVGQRTAQRLAFHLLRVPSEDAMALSDAIREVKERIGFCEECFNLAEGDRCRFCLDARRDRALICVVEAPSDIDPHRADGRVPGPVPRARRRAVADRRHRSRRTCESPSSRPAWPARTGRSRRSCWPRIRR